MFPADTPFFSLSSEFFHLFVDFFSDFYDALSEPVSTLIDPLLDVPDLFTNLVAKLLNYILDNISFADKTLGETSLMAVLFGAFAGFIAVYSIIKWIVGIVTGS